MSDVIGFGTAFQNPDEGGAWEAAEGTDVTPQEVLDAIRDVCRAYNMTEEEFNSNEPLYLTEIHRVRQITWEEIR